MPKHLAVQRMQQGPFSGAVTLFCHLLHRMETEDGEPTRMADLVSSTISYESIHSPGKPGEQAGASDRTPLASERSSQKNSSTTSILISRVFGERVS